MRRLIKLALIIAPIFTFYFWSYLGLGILAVILIVFRILTWKHEPKMTKNETVTEKDDDDDSPGFRNTSLLPEHTFSITNLNHKGMYDD